ncbi:MAG: hypothetical protein ACXVRH_14800, partial [Thermoleophilaceae bacterium]
MVKKVLIAVMAGALLAPVGLALSNTGGKGSVRGGSQKCSYYAKRAHAAGGSHPVKKCVVVVVTTGAAVMVSLPVEVT